MLLLIWKLYLAPLNLVWLSVFTRAQEKTHLKRIIREVSQEHWEGYFFFSLWKYRNLPRWPKPTLYKIYIRNMHSPCAAVWVWELDSFKQVPWRSLLIGELGKRTKHSNTAALVTLDLHSAKSYLLQRKPIFLRRQLTSDSIYSNRVGVLAMNSSNDPECA